MRRPLFAAIVFTFLISSAVFPQDKLSIQFNGGIIMPLGSSKGLSGAVQLNYIYSQSLQFYIYSGHSVWDQRYYDYQKEGNNERENSGRTYWQDEHELVPVYAGCRINLHTNKLFTSYLNVEAGYSYLTYNSYTVKQTTDPDTGEETGYAPDLSTRTEHDEDLFAIGFGAGISHPMSDNIKLMISFKLNSFVNSNYNGLFSSQGTYTMFMVGVNYLI
jgi:hypothetical protein